MSTVSAVADNLVQASEAKDPYSRGHGHAVAFGAVTVAKELGFTASHVEHVETAALLHDVGNLQVDAALLTKPGRLAPGEFGRIREHPTAGAHLLQTFPELKDLAPAVAAHHERWDGQGYPQGKRGKDIPLEARIIAVSECFNAMTSARPHRRAFSPRRAVLGLKTAARSQLDPELVEAFLAGVQRLVPPSTLESDEGVLNLDQVVRQEKQQLKLAFTMVTQSFLWMFDRLLGRTAAVSIETEVNDFLRQHRVAMQVRRGRVLDFTPSSASPEELAENYKLALARAYAVIEDLVGRTVARRCLKAALSGLSEPTRRICQVYHLCAMAG